MDTSFGQFRMLLAVWEALRRKDALFGGKTALDFERRLAERLGAPHLLGVASGTDALILALKAYDIGPGDEVIVPATSAFATAAAVHWINAAPVFADVDREDGNLDAGAAEQVITRNTRAIIIVHLHGRMVPMEKFSAIARKYKLALIEDAAQAIGARYKNHPIGYYGDVACLSFNPTKILNARGDGGAVITKHEDIADKISMMRTYGAKISEIHQRHPIVGVSSRLSALHAAVLSAELPRLDILIGEARQNYFLYMKLLAGVGDLTFPMDALDSCFINGHRFMAFTSRRAELLQFLAPRMPQWMPPLQRLQYGPPLPLLAAFSSLKHRVGEFPGAERISRESIVLPTHPYTAKQVKAIARLVRDLFDNRR